ncbi:hypothetical protein T484DRAFT_1758566, partial [Baffinella frigidus]
MTSVLPEDDEVQSMIAQLAALPRASEANSAMLVFNTLDEEVGFVDNYMTSVPLDTKTDSTMREKHDKFSSILTKEHTDDTIEITGTDRVNLKGIRTLLSKDMRERLHRVMSERSKMMGQLSIYFKKSPSEFFSGLQNTARDDISKDHIRVTYQVPWEDFGQGLDYAKDHKDDLEGIVFDPNYNATMLQSQKKIEHGLFEYLVVGMLPKNLLHNVPAEPMGLGGKLAESSPIHADTTAEGHRTTGYTPDTPDTAETEDIDETFCTTYIEWMSTLQNDMTPIMNAQVSTHIRDNIHAIQSTHIFNP